MGELTPERLAELRRIAEAATPGLWWVDGWEARTNWEVDANIQYIELLRYKEG